MRVIGIAGGIASGKTLVADCLRHLGAEVLDADRIGHAVLRQPQIKQKVIERFGPEIFREGEISRPDLAQMVFGSRQENRQNLADLEQITHPEIGRQLALKLDELRTADRLEAVVLDAPVMFKAGWDQLCDEIVFVDVDFETRRSRTISNRNWPADELKKREEQQFPLEEKKKRATAIVNNSGTRQETLDQVIALWKGWGFSMPSDFKSPTH